MFLYIQSKDESIRLANIRLDLVLLQVKGAMTSETRREALHQLHNMEAEMKAATERMAEMKEEKEQERSRERHRQKILTPGSAAAGKTPKRTPARFGL